jgi:hypothetical protein
MAVDGTIPNNPSIPAIDRAVDVLEIVDISAGTTNKTTPSFMLGITGNPVGTTDSQTMTNKILTAPTISSPVLSGTLTGTYTIGGSPTFPSSVTTLTGIQTLTNKTLTSPTITSPTITNASITADAISGFTVANTGTIFGMAITSGAIPNSALPSGTALQAVNFTTGALATGTTLVPVDDTIPQNTEGDQYMTLSITPKATTNILIIQVVAFAVSSVAGNVTMALFQDSTANALAAAYMGSGTSGNIPLVITYKMVAGTVSSTAFKIRIGGQLAGTVTFNGLASARFYGGVLASGITITEYKA